MAGNASQIFVHNIWAFGGIRFAYGLFAAGVFPTVNAMVVERTSAEFRGRAFGLTTSANQIGAMVGPLIGGVLGGWVGIHVVFVFTGFLLTTVGCIVWLSNRNTLLLNQQNSNSKVTVRHVR